ncbi:MAG TPA: hypothetical protein VMT12_15065 [Syntrophales bacterium]|nr:hypothetical protein [Syntrophales bacterium]
MRYKIGLAIILTCVLYVISVQTSGAQQKAPEEKPAVHMQQSTTAPECKEGKKEEKKDEFREYKPPPEQGPLERRPPVRNK